jgi:hypothetical protein
MSDTVMDTPEESHSGNMTVRGMKPDTYSGDRSKLETWLLQVDRYFHVEGDRIESVDKVVLASTYLRGDAEKWSIPIIRKYMDDKTNDPANTALVEDWDQFKERMRQIFAPFTEKVVSEQKIQTIKQTRSAADYTTLFQRLAENVDWDDNALMRMYRQGLKPAVRKELMRSGSTLDTLRELTTEAIRLDNELYELALEEQLFNGKRAYESNPRQGRQPSNHGRARAPYHMPGVYRGYGQEAMHVDAVEMLDKKRHWKVKTGKTGKGTKEVTCYSCGKKGHFARDCRNKNKVIRTANAIGRKSHDKASDADLWEIVAPMEDAKIACTDEESTEDYEWVQDIPETVFESYTSQPHKAVEEPKLWRNWSKEEWTGAWDQVSTLYEQDLAMEPECFSAHPGTKWKGITDKEPTKEELRAHEQGIREKVCKRKTQACDQCRRRSVRCDKVEGQPKCYRCAKKNANCTYQPKGVRWAESNEWQDKIKQEFQPVAEALAPNGFPRVNSITGYDRDYRNPKHAKLHYSACTYDYCDYHYEAKVRQSCFPTPKGKCRWQWYDCNNDLCRDHLWDKRTTDYFPGQTDEDQLARLLIITNKCRNAHWQVCMNPQCISHQEEKNYYGFEEKSFLDRNQKLGLLVSPPPTPDSDQESEDATASEMDLGHYA